MCAIAVLVGAVSASACGPFVAELDGKNANLTVPDKGDTYSVIQSPDELAKSKFFTDDAGRDAIKKQVDFRVEKIVVVTWYGSSTSWVTHAFSKDGKKVLFEIVTGVPALADLRPHIHLFTIPKDVVVETPMDRLKNPLDLRNLLGIANLSMKDVKIVRDRNELPPGAVVIASADDLAKSRLFADDAGRDALAKQIDFANKKLVVFVWSGSGGDTITASVRGEAEDKIALFTYTRGETDDLRDHALAFAVPKDYEVKVMEKE
jgi:hypothetical protein